MKLLMALRNMWYAHAECPDAQRLLVEAALNHAGDEYGLACLNSLASTLAALDPVVKQRLLSCNIEPVVAAVWRRREEDVSAVKAMVVDSSVPQQVRLAGFWYAEKLSDQELFVLLDEYKQDAAEVALANVDRLSLPVALRVFPYIEGNVHAEMDLCDLSAFAAHVLSEPAVWPRRVVFACLSTLSKDPDRLTQLLNLVGLDELDEAEVGNLCYSIANTNVPNSVVAAVLDTVALADPAHPMHYFAREAAVFLDPKADLEEVLRTYLSPLVITGTWNGLTAAQRLKVAPGLLLGLENTHPVFDEVVAAAKQVCGDKDFDEFLLEQKPYNYFAYSWQAEFPKTFIAGYTGMFGDVDSGVFAEALWNVEPEHKLRLGVQVLKQFHTGELSALDVEHIHEDLGMPDEVWLELTGDGFIQLTNSTGPKFSDYVTQMVTGYLVQFADVPDVYRSWAAAAENALPLGKWMNVHTAAHMTGGVG